MKANSEHEVVLSYVFTACIFMGMVSVVVAFLCLVCIPCSLSFVLGGVMYDYCNNIVYSVF